MRKSMASALPEKAAARKLDKNPSEIRKSPDPIKKMSSGTTIKLAITTTGDTSPK